MKMIEWKKLPRSIRFENEMYILDVWKFLNENKKIIFRYTIFDKIKNEYIGHGETNSEDESCELALKFAKI